MTTVRPEILRHYYETTFDHRDEGAYQSATFDEVVALVRITDPDITPRSVAECGGDFGRRDLEKLAADLPPDPPPDQRTDLGKLGERHPVVSLHGGGAVDLRQALAGKDARGVEAQRLDVIGWEGLRAPEPWLHIELRVCTTSTPVTLEPALHVDRLRLVECEPRCFETVLRSTRARSAELHHRYPIDLGLLAAHDRLERLSCFGPSIESARALGALPLRSLWLKEADLDDEILGVVRALGPGLESLALIGDTPFAPADLGDLPRLQTLTVRAWPELRSAWIDFAVAHPAIRFVFVRPDPAARKVPKPKPAPTKTAAPAAPKKRSLTSLRKEPRFASWEGHVRADRIEASRSILTELIDTLLDLGSSATAARQREAVRQAVVRFNELDAEQHFITTIEAEDISRAIDDIANVTRLAGEDDIAGAWRDW